MRRVRMMSLTLVSFVLCVPYLQASASPIPPAAVKWYREGVAKAKADPQQALVAFQKALSLAPDYEPALYEEGSILAVVDFPKSIPVLKHLAKIAPQNDTVWNILGWGYYKHHEYGDALASFRRQLAVAPGSTRAEWGIANVAEDNNVRAYSLARRYLTRLSHSADYASLAQRLLSNLPPDSLDPAFNARKSATYEEAIAIALSYRNVLHTPADTSIRAEDGRAPSSSLLPYVTWATNHHLIDPASIPSFQQPATRLFVALLVAKLYGLDRFQYIRPFSLSDLGQVSVNDAMYVNSVLANHLMSTATSTTFAPDGTMTRQALFQTIDRANRIMKTPPVPSSWLTPPQPLWSGKPWVYFFSIGSPDRSLQASDIALHRQELSALGFTSFPFTADLPKWSGAVITPADLGLTSASPKVQTEIAQATANHVQTFAVLGNYNMRTNESDPAVVHELLTSATAQAGVIAQVVNLIQSGMSGVTVDFENMDGRDRTAYVQFLAALHAAVRSAGGRTMVCLPERSGDDPLSAYDYSGLAANADLVMLITYDEHTPSSKPGPIEQLFNADRVVKYAVQQIDPKKLLLGVADYGYDWSNGTGVEVSMDEAQQVAASHGARVVFDSASQTPHFTYTDKGAEHVVWFEDKQSIADVLSLVRAYGLQGIAVWHFGSENESFWRTVSATLGVK